VELPLFPLSTVLHPGLPISLHVFEDRYWEMSAGPSTASGALGGRYRPRP